MQRVLSICVIAAMAASMPGFADSLFRKASSERGNLISNKRPEIEVGDLIVVMVRENVDSQTQANTDTRKQSEISNEADEGANGFLTNPEPDGFGLLDAAKLPNWEIEGDNEHRTQGQTRRTNRLVTTVSCTVTKVHENGNLDIEGERRITINREDTMIAVAGTIRARDVTAANTIDSTQVANAQIDLKGKGPLWNNQRRGLLTKLLDWFSPY